jgi:acetyl esterase/lipase
VSGVTRVHFSGPSKYRLRSAAEFAGSIAQASARRLLHGPRLPSWNWHFEVGTYAIKRQLITAFDMPDVNEARQYLDAIVIGSSALDDLAVTPVEQEHVRGAWYVGRDAHPDRTVLYIHGGAFCFYPKAYAQFIGLITQAIGGRVFAVDYRLAPEHCFPAQLEDVLSAYRWLLQNGANPDHLLVIGDSAGGNLTLSLLLIVRDLHLPQPALAIALSPPTDFETQHPSTTRNQEYDWLEARMLLRWSDWYCNPTKRRDPLVGTSHADLRGLAPIYLQAGRAEIMYDSIQAFAYMAQRQGVDVVLESWQDMTHDFQVFGRAVPQSAAALQRIFEVVQDRLGLTNKPVSVDR